MLGRPRIEDLTWDPPGPDPLHGAARPQAGGRSRRVRGRPGRGRARRADGGGGHEGPRPAPRGGTPSSTRSRGGPPRPATSPSRTSPGPSSRSSRPGRIPGRSATRRSRSRSATPTRCRRSTRRCAERCRARRGSSARPSPTTSPTRSSRARPSTTRLTLAALKEKKLPALDDEFARPVAEGETAESLREKVRGPGCGARRRRERRRKFRRAILDALLSRRDVPAPEVLVESETHAALRGLRPVPGRQRRGSREEADWEKLRDDARPGAERRVQEYLLLDAIAEREGIAGLRDGARGGVQAGRGRARRRARRRCGSRWPRPAGSRRSATRCGSRRPSTS